LTFAYSACFQGHIIHCPLSWTTSQPGKFLFGSALCS
jgi:hypothetical protein